jgi:hypothetical protein
VRVEENHRLSVVFGRGGIHSWHIRARHLLLLRSLIHYLGIEFHVLGRAFFDALLFVHFHVLLHGHLFHNFLLKW